MVIRTEAWVGSRWLGACSEPIVFSMSLFVLCAAVVVMFWAVGMMFATEREVRMTQMQFEEIRRIAAEKERELSDAK